MKNKILLFIVIFSVANIFTFPAFTVTHGLDSYCTVYNGYSDTALWFAQNGRVITALFYYLSHLKATCSLIYFCYQFLLRILT